MGPLATIDLYAKIVELTNAAKDQDPTARRISCTEARIRFLL